jgi:hypothetical protein
MAVTRRSFLVGAGSIITAAYVKQVKAYVFDTGSPMIAQDVAWRVDNPGEVKTIFCEPVEDYWHLHLGEPHFAVPEPPLLVENLRFHGYVLDTQEQIDAVCADTGWSESDLFSPMDGFVWDDQWEHTFSPEAQAFEFLQRHQIFPHGHIGRREGELFFESFPNPMSNARWVEVHDLLSLSLLQARLNELRLTTQVRMFDPAS